LKPAVEHDPAVGAPEIRGPKRAAPPPAAGAPPPGSHVTTPPKTAKTSNAQIDRERQQFFDSGKNKRVITEPAQAHHIASDKSSKYSPQFEKIFEDGGMSLQDPANLVSIEGHGNAHGPDYHEAVLKRLRKAIENKSPGTPEYREALRKELVSLKRDLDRPGSTLNNLVTKSSASSAGRGIQPNNPPVHVRVGGEPSETSTPGVGAAHEPPKSRIASDVLEKDVPEVEGDLIEIEDELTDPPLKKRYQEIR
jgi:hypothetical protein